MRIAFIVPRFPVISETFILNQIIGMIQLGHDVRIFAISRGETSETHEDVETYGLMDRVAFLNEERRFWVKNAQKQEDRSIYSSLNRSLNVTLRALNIIKYGRKALSFDLAREGIFFLGEKPYDVYHCHFGQIGMTMANMVEIGSIEGKLITTFHGHDITKYVEKHGKDVYKRLFARGDLFLPISNRWKDRLIELGCEKEKIVVHRMGIDLGKFDFSSYKCSDPKRMKILTVGRLVEKKGIEYGIRAVGQVVKTYPGIEYTIVGDGPLREHLLGVVRNLNLEKKIRVVGKKTQAGVQDLMKESDLFLCPSVTSSDGNQEGIPVVLMEAMACGLPVISTFHSGIPELVMEGETGYLVNEHDVSGLAEKIEFALKHPETLKSITQKAHEHVEQFYDIDKLNRRLFELYESS